MTCQVTEQVGATGPRPLLTPAPEPAAPRGGSTFLPGWEGK